MRKAFGHVSELLKGFGYRLTPSGCALRVPEAERGRVPCDGAEEVCRREPHETGSAEPAKDGEGDSPSPLSSLCRYRAPKPAPTDPRSSVLPTRRRDGVLRRDIGDAERGERIFRKRPQGARSEARAGSLRRRGGNIRSTASKTNTSQLRSTTPLTKTKKV